MSQAVKVGIFAVVAFLILGYLILRIEHWDLFGGKGWRVDAVFDSVAGLDDKAAVRVAGVRVGRVDGIGLEGARARVTLLLDRPLGLTEGTYARISNLGLLGDKYIELVPGPPEATKLAEGAVLPGETPVGFDQAMEKLNRIGDSIEQALSSFSSEGGGASLGRLVQNLEATSGEIRELVATNRETVSATARNFERMSATLADQLPRLTRQMEHVLAQVDAVLAENRGELAGSMKNIEEITGQIKESVANLNEITGKIASGEGTVGKLINSDQAHEELVSTLESVKSGVDTLSNTLGAVQRLKLDLGLESYYLQGLDDTHSTFRIDLDPKPGGYRIYRVGVVDDPRGKLSTKTQRITTTSPDGTLETRTVETETTRDSPTVTALLGLRTKEGPRLWAGLIEDNFGVQLDYPFLRRKLWLSLEAFDFSRQENRRPHLRFATEWRFHPNLYLIGGYDDFLESDRDSVFLGGGIRWSDDELKYLLGSLPKP